MNYIVENWYVIAAVIAVTVAATTAVIQFSKYPRQEQIDKVRQWLVYATSIAEKELGGGTGQLKLRYVYDMFVLKFPWLVKLISFDMFSTMVDEALEDMNKLLTTNTAVATYITGAETN